MAYVDILSPDAYGRFNRKLAKLTSLVVAVYWSEILDISNRVVKEQLFDDEGYFNVDRNYIRERTTVGVNEQMESDSVLENIGILEVNENNPDMIRVKLETAISILVDDDFKLNKTAKKRIGISKVQAAENKKAGIIANMKKCIREEDESLRSKYEAWVESVYAGGHFLTKALVQTFEDRLNGYTSRRAIKADILDLACATGYNNFEWVLSRYESTAKKNTASRLAEQKISNGVKTDINF